MKLRYFSRAVINRLHKDSETNVDKYGDPRWLASLADSHNSVLESNRVVDPPPRLVYGERDNSRHDAENARLIYRWLSTLPPAVAMEERLWGYLTHCVFQDYMAARWPVTSAGRIRRRYLLEAKTFAALTRNGISRLWWGAKLTYDEGRRDPLELTDVLFMIQDIHVSLLERSLSKCVNVRMAVLDFLRDNSTRLAEEAFGRRIQALLKELNLLGGVAILDALPQAQLKSFLEKAARRIGKVPAEEASLIRN